MKGFENGEWFILESFEDHLWAYDLVKEHHVPLYYSECRINDPEQHWKTYPSIIFYDSMAGGGIRDNKNKMLSKEQFERKCEYCSPKLKRLREIRELKI